MMRNISLKKSVFLISLALFFPEIVASKTLDVNYDNSSDLTLSPRSALQLNACHTKADPMTIHVKFGQMMVPTEKVTLTIEGADYRKSYSVFSDSDVRNRATSKDSGFLVPWNVSVRGSAKGSGFVTQNIPGKPEEYSGAFCFAEGVGNSNLISGSSRFYYNNENDYYLYPLFKDGLPAEIMNNSTFDANELNKQQFADNCQGRNLTKDLGHVWKDGPQFGQTNIPNNIKSAMNDSGDPAAFLGKGIFYMSHADGIPDSSQQNSKSFETQANNDSLPANTVYTFPISDPNGSGETLLNQGDFVLTLNNRNISKLTLKIGETAWSWEADNNNGAGNDLYLHKVTDYPISIGLDDPALNGSYNPLKSEGNVLPDNFYVNDYLAKSYFRGTLVKASALSQTYTDYINQAVPLSLPPTDDGTINIVNTDSLTFIIGQNRVSPRGAFSNYYLRVSGQPLKFAPFVQNGNEVVSAMKFRNACY